MKCPALFSFLVAATLFSADPIRCVYIIKRNSQDCIYPRIQANAERLWPSNQYLPRGITISSTGNSLLVRYARPHRQSRRLHGTALTQSSARTQADGPGFSIEYFSTYKVNSGSKVKGLRSVAGTAAAAAGRGVACCCNSWKRALLTVICRLPADRD